MVQKLVLASHNNYMLAEELSGYLRILSAPCELKLRTTEGHAVFKVHLQRPAPTLPPHPVRLFAHLTART
jgi:hypothetical protein